MTTYFAAIDTNNTGTVYGIGTSESAAIEDARRGLGSDADSLVTVPMSERAYHHVDTHGGQPSAKLSFSRARGVLLRDEE